MNVQGNNCDKNENLPTYLTHENSYQKDRQEEANNEDVRIKSHKYNEENCTEKSNEANNSKQVQCIWEDKSMETKNDRNIHNNSYQNEREDEVVEDMDSIKIHRKHKKDITETINKESNNQLKYESSEEKIKQSNGRDEAVEDIECIKNHENNEQN